MKSVVVIGGGLAGLSTAALLAQHDYQVTLIEKNPELGGRARVFQKDGFTFDMGPSWYLMPEVVEEIFHNLGHKTSEFFTLTPLDPKYKVFFEHRKPITLADSLEKNLRLFEKNAPGSRKNLERLLQKTGSAYDIAVKSFLQKAYHSPLDFLNAQDIRNGLSLLRLFNPFQSYHELIRKHISNPDLQKILEFHTVFLGGNPFNTPALYSMLIAADFQKKVWYPMGGMGKLVNALQTIGEDAGVTFKTDSEVRHLHIDKKQKKIIRVDTQKESIPADIVVNTTDYANFDLTLLSTEYQEYSSGYWEKRTHGISSILVFLGVNKKIPALAHHNFYFQNNWEHHFSTLEKTTRLPENPCFYLSVPSVSDPAVAPPGNENLFILIPTSIKSEGGNIDAYVDTVLQRVEKMTGSSFRSNICLKRIYTHQDFSSDYAAYRGNALGLAHTLRQSVFFRPRMKSKNLKNLYFAGQFTQPGVGVPMVLLSSLYISTMLQHDSP